jgi:SPP1 family holin
VKKIVEWFKNIDVKKTVRSLLQILVYINQLLVVMDRTPFGDSTAYSWIAFLLTIGITALTYWKNNDWTNAAKTSGEILEILKDGRVTQKEIEDFINKYKQEE